MHVVLCLLSSNLPYNVLLVLCYHSPHLYTLYSICLILHYHSFHSTYICFSMLHLCPNATYVLSVHLALHIPSARQTAHKVLMFFYWISAPAWTVLYYACKFHNCRPLENIKKNGINLSQQNTQNTNERRHTHTHKKKKTQSYLLLSCHVEARAGIHFAASSFINCSGELFFALLTIHYPPSTRSLSVHLFYTQA